MREVKGLLLCMSASMGTALYRTVVRTQRITDKTVHADGVGLAGQV